MAQTLSEFESKVETASETFEAQLVSLQETQEAQSAAAFAAVQERLTAAETKATRLFDQESDRHIEQRREFRSEFDEAQAERDRHSNETAEAHVAQAEEIISELQANLDKANELVGMIGEDAMRGHYGRNANEQKKEADRWRWAAVGASLLAIGSAGLLLWYGLFNRTDRDWIDLVTRLGVTAGVTALAAYLANQAKSHRRREEKYRELELELAVLDPFLSTMTDAERHNIKTQLASKYFVGVDPNAPPLVILDEEPA